MTWNGPVGDALRAELAQPIATLPNNQGAFKLVQRELDNLSWQQAQRARGVVVDRAHRRLHGRGPLSSGAHRRGRAAELLREGRARGIYVNPNHWARDQLVVYVDRRDRRRRSCARSRSKGARLRAAFDTLAARNTETEPCSRRRARPTSRPSILAAKGWGAQGAARLRPGAGHHGDARPATRATSSASAACSPTPGATSSSSPSTMCAAELPDSTRLDALTDELLAQFALGSLRRLVRPAGPPPPRPPRHRPGGAPTPPPETRGLWRMTQRPHGRQRTCATPSSPTAACSSTTA